MAEVIDFRTRRIIASDKPPQHAVHLWKDRGQVHCPYCHKAIVIPPSMNASFTCQPTGHFHMFSKVKLEEKE